MKAKKLLLSSSLHQVLLGILFVRRVCFCVRTVCEQCVNSGGVGVTLSMTNVFQNRREPPFCIGTVSATPWSYGATSGLTVGPVSNTSWLQLAESDEDLSLEINLPSTAPVAGSELIIEGVKATAKLDEAAGTVEFTVTYTGDAWIGLGVSQVPLSRPLSSSSFLPPSPYPGPCSETLRKCSHLHVSTMMTSRL